MKRITYEFGYMQKDSRFNPKNIGRLTNSLSSKLIIPGNHDLSLDPRFVHSHAAHDPQHRQPPNLSPQEAQTRHQTALDFWTSPTGRACSEGVTYLSEGTHSIPLPNGAVAKVYASPYTPEFWDWAFAYGPREDRFSEQDETLEWVTSFAENPIPTRRTDGGVGGREGSSGDDDVDIVITHGPPYKRLDPTASVPAVGCPLLLRAVMRARPKVCCFGHIHEGWGAERLKWAGRAGEVATKECSLEEWKEKVWEEGVEKVERIEVDLEHARERRAVYVDVSEEGGRELKDGEETLFVNAAVMDVDYRPVNAPWVVDLDLPRAGGDRL